MCLWFIGGEGVIYNNAQNPSPQGGSDRRVDQAGGLQGWWGIGPVNAEGGSFPVQSSTPQKSPAARGGSRGYGNSPRSAVSRVLNLDIMSDSTPDLHHQGLSTPSCPTSSVRGGRSKQSVSRKRNVDGSQKSMTKTTKQMSEGRSSSPGYSTMLKELTNAVKETPPLPRTDKLDKWGEVLVLDLCEFPIEIQHEARHHINEYVMNLRRSYALTACLQTTADIQRLLLLQVMRPKQLQGFRLP